MYTTETSLNPVCSRSLVVHLNKSSLWTNQFAYYCKVAITVLQETSEFARKPANYDGSKEYFNIYNAQMLEVSNINKTYSSTQVLRDLSFQLRPHEIIFLSGPSGSGKSTALRCIANLDPFDNGRVTLNGKSPAQTGFSQWRQKVMYVPQHRVALRGTPADLLTKALRFGAQNSLTDDCINERVKEYLKTCTTIGLEESIISSQPWSELSGGQAQRATVALCISMRPEVLLLDEPSSSCDLQSALLVEKAIKDSGISAVWVSHDISQPQRVGGRIQTIFPLRSSV